MSNKIIDFRTGKKIKSDPHITGECHCIGYKHEWEGVAPVGTYQLQCPKCSSYKGQFLHMVVKKDTLLTCCCGNDLLHVNQEGIYCPNCGVDFDFDYIG